MKEITLTQGKAAVVDDEDFEKLSRFKWRAWFKRNHWYAVTTITDSGGQCRNIEMHRMIMGYGYGDKAEVDHRDRDGLNNTRMNLRNATRTQNRQNQAARSDNRSGFKGVGYCKATGTWRVRITVNGERLMLGYFKDPLDGAIAYDAAAMQHFGEFAVTNIPF